MSEREPIYQDGLPFGGYVLSVGKGDVDGATVGLCYNHLGIHATVSPEDMRALALQLHEAANEVESARIERAKYLAENGTLDVRKELTNAFKQQ